MASRIRVFLNRDKLEDVLRSVGVRVVSETEHELLCYCPFHHNTDSPAFNISKREPHLWKCWNGKCDKRGNIFTLLTQKGYSFNEAKRMIVSGEVDMDEFAEYMRELLAEMDEEPHNAFKDVDPNTFRRSDEKHGFPAREYLRKRGIGDEAYEYFRMGFAPKTGMLVIPAFDEHNQLIGVIGRSIKDKRYKYSAGLTRGRTIWNIYNASAMMEDEICLTEGALDAVYIWQAGYGSVGAVLGSAISGKQWELLRKYYSAITCFFDNDDPGNALRDSIIQTPRGFLVSAVQYPDRPVKDPGDLSQDEIRQMVTERRTSVQYLLGL